VAKGIDPSKSKREAKTAAAAKAKEQAATFEAVAREWFAIKRESYRESQQKKILWFLSLLFPHIGGIPLASLEPLQILSAIRPIDEKGHSVTAHKLVQVAGQICRFGMRLGYAKYNAAAGLTEAIKPIKSEHYAAITDPQKIGALLRSIDEYNGSVSIRFALRILPYVFLRNSELRGAEWREIDFDNAIWIVPAVRSDKNGTGMKMRTPHIVPLARQVVGLFRELHLFTGGSTLCFPSPHSQSRCISDMGLLNALRRLGYTKDEMTIHGFRAMFSTLCNEQGFNRDHIEKQLAHQEGNKIREAYNHALYLEERRAMMQEYADFLDGLREQS
jgi:integrase